MTASHWGWLTVVGRLSRRITGIEFGRVGVTHGSRVKPFSQFAPAATTNKDRSVLILEKSMLGEAREDDTVAWLGQYCVVLQDKVKQAS
jgi:hypothetical protein